jgi:hypothetical protein
LIARRAPSVRALEATLERLVHFLNVVGVLAFWTGPHQISSRSLRLLLEKMGFRIESGTCREKRSGSICATVRVEPSARIV